MNGIEYRIQTWQESYGDKPWRFCIKRYVRTTFKRSKRTGWSWRGFVTIDAPHFDTRAEALAYAKTLKQELVK